LQGDEMMQNLLLITLLVFNFSLSANVSPEEKGLDIALQMEKANSGFVGESSQMKMELIDAYGARVTRLMEGKVREVSEDGDQSLSIFLNPKDVKGTKMLTWSHKDKDDDQWLFLPSSKRVKRISSRGKSASFMGSEFSYEDLGSQEVEKYNFKWLKDQKLDGSDVWVLERKSKKKSGYSKMILFVSKKYLNSLKTEYYDRKGELLKVAAVTDFQNYKVPGKSVWRSSKIHMKNIQTKKESIISWDQRKLGVKFKAKDFKKRSLK
jgi:hypothetical protein